MLILQYVHHRSNHFHLILGDKGFVHAAFTFHQEALLNRYNVDSSQIPPGLLLSFVQRGIDFLSIEEQVTLGSSDYLRDATTPDGTRSLLDFHRYMSNPEDYDTSNNQGADVQMTEKIPTETREKEENVRDHLNESVLYLHGHKLRVSSCKWDPQESMLASCSYDNSVRIWTIPENFPEKQVAGDRVTPRCRKIRHDILKKTPSKTMLTNSLEVTAIGWNSTGRTLATGCDDGITRLCDKNGQIKALAQNHSDTITVLKWNEGGTHFVTGSLDMSVAVCDNETAKCFKQFNHNQAVYDLDWKDDDVFASGSADGTVRVCSVNGDVLTQTLLGHKGEINCIKFSCDKTQMASGSEDKTVKIWDAQSYRIIHTLKGHGKEVYTLDWSPDVTKTRLVSGSFDSTIKLWNVKRGKCIQTMAHDFAKVYSVKYSPDGKLIASGADDGSVIIWSATTGLVLKTFLGDGAVYGIDWYRTGEMLAVCRESGVVCVIDIRQWMEI